MEVPASQHNVTQSKRRKVNVPLNPAVLFDTWPDGPPSGVDLSVGALLSYHRVLAPDTPPHTGSCRVTSDEVALSNPQGKGMVDAVSTSLHASLTSAPPGSIPTHLVTVGPVPHASASGFSGLPTFGPSDCNDAAPVETAKAGPQDSKSIPPSLPHSMSTLTHVHSTQLLDPLDQQSQSLQTRVTEHSTAIVPELSQSPYSPLSLWTPCGQDSPQTLAHPVVAPSEMIQVTDLLALFAGVTSTTPVAAQTMSTPRTTSFSVPGLVD